MDNGVSPSFARIFGSAPASIHALTTSACPCHAARYSGVRPSLSAASIWELRMSPNKLIIVLAASPCPFPAAKWRGVSPELSLAIGGSPRLARILKQEA